MLLWALDRFSREKMLRGILLTVLPPHHCVAQEAPLSRPRDLFAAQSADARLRMG